MRIRSKSVAAVTCALLMIVLVGCPSETTETPSEKPTTSAQAGCGRLTTPCATGEPCEGAADCQSGACREAKCQEIVPADNEQNNGETDVDCGGPQAAACDDGKKCGVAEDCKSGVCKGGVCQAPGPNDGVKNGDETGLDCGGTKAPKCGEGQGCASNADCDGLKCDPVQKKCAPASHDDGIKNLDETGVDCGGPTATKKCAPGEGCAGDADCDATRCNVMAKTCNPPTATDGLKNGTETDVDCGGGAPTNARRCRDGSKPSASESCDVDGDCASGFCSFDKKCVTGRSCKGAVGNATAGIRTCGRYEPNNLLAANAHEYCCQSLPLPTTTTVRLDKYEVTAGRFRQFVESIPGRNIRQWAKNEIAAGTKAGRALQNDLTTAMVDLLPASANPGEPLNLVMQIGATVMAISEPSFVQGCFQDYVNTTNGAYGANTYYWDHPTLQAHLGAGIKPRRFAKNVYDEKSMNCAPYWMYAAFCAWDGGRLPTHQEMHEAYGATYYPWNSNSFGTTFPLAGGQTYEDVSANYFNNKLYFYAYPEYGDARDLAGYISAPGRFPKDRTARTSANGEAWMDLGANMMEVTRYNSGDVNVATCAAPPGGGTCQQGAATFCDVSLGQPAGTPVGSRCSSVGPDGRTYAGVIRATGLPTSLWVGGSWEGHYQFGTTNGALGTPVRPEPYFTRNSYNFRAQTQYGKTGFRCAR